MALTGLQIQKLLPGTNCKECGSNTCLAFAMKLAGKKAELSACPYASDEIKRVLGAASEPPVRVTVLGPEKTLKLGGETVLYRHEKTFVHQTAFAVNINDTDAAAEVAKVLAAVRDYKLDRVGETLTVELVAVTQKSGSAETFAAAAKQAYETTKKPLVLRSADAAALAAAAVAVKGSGSILSAATPESAAELSKVAAANGHALAITAPDLDALAALSSTLRDAGFKDVILQPTTYSEAEQFQVNSISRSLALKHGFKAFGCATLRFIEGGDYVDSTISAVTELSKYGGVCVLPTFDPAQLSVLMTLRQNIYTDPQKPIQVEPKVYAVGEPNENSPVFVTTNFSLTYFIVSGEIENSGTSAWLVVPECEGMSVLTAWAAGKFGGGTIAKFIKSIGLEQQVKTREIIIPGYVAQISGELEEGLPGWKVLVGPQEAGDIESFVKARLAK